MKPAPRGRVFTANMTGNVVLLGFGLAGTDGLPVLAPLVSLAAVVCASVHVRGGSFAAGVVIALLALAMGLRNAVVRKLAVAELTTTVLTMTVTGLAADGAAVPRATQLRRVAALGAMLAGALVGALLVAHTLWLPLALVAAAAGTLAWVAHGLAARAAPSS